MPRSRVAYRNRGRCRKLSSSPHGHAHAFLLAMGYARPRTTSQHTGHTHEVNSSQFRGDSLVGTAGRAVREVEADDDEDPSDDDAGLELLVEEDEPTDENHERNHVADE